MRSIADIKSGLHQYVAQTDNVEALTKLQQYVQELMSTGDEIIAYTSRGVPLNQEAYKTDVDDAIAEAKSGEVISIEDMEKEL
ncbi:MAG: hypothetical protein RIF33_25995 [Cyclobacteriaceae bacterium]